jgi:hypothetical protein
MENRIGLERLIVNLNAVNGYYKTVYSHYRDIQRMVGDGRWKLIRYYKAAKDGAGSERIQLFDLASDAWELNDVSAEHPGEVERLQGELAQWMQAVGDPLYTA